MKLLYLSCHEVLEYSEVSLFHEMGIEIFSPGAYVCPQNRGDNSLRPDIHGLVYSPDIVEQWNILGAKYPGTDAKYHLEKSFVDNFDAVMVMHIPEWITNNWEAMKHKTVIWRTIGQSLGHQEQLLESYRRKGLKIVRYSPYESYTPRYIGHDAVIRFHDSSEDHRPWIGTDLRVVTFAQSMKARGEACNYNFFVEMSEGLNRVIYGPNNEDCGELNGGKLTYDEQKKQYSRTRVYFAGGTHPAPYTLNFMEALLAGCPILAPGKERGNAPYFHGHKTYEVHTLIKSGVNGFISDNPLELRSVAENLLRDDHLAKRISTAGRALGASLFGKKRAKAEWAALFKQLGLE